jgi:hypothetical protein
MSGWNSIDSVGTLHIALQTIGLLVAVVVIAAGMTAYHFWSRWDALTAIVEQARRRYLPRWRSCDTAMTLHNAFVEIAILGIATLLAIAYAASQYGHRKVELAAIAHAAELAKVQYDVDALRRALAERDARIVNALALRTTLREDRVRHLAEVAELRRELERAQVRRATALAEGETEARLVAEIDTLRRGHEQAAARHAGDVAELRQRLQQAETRRATAVESLRLELKQTEARAAQSSEAEARLLGEIDTLRRGHDQTTARHAGEVTELRQRLQQAESRRIATVESLRWEVKQAEARAAGEIERLSEQLARSERQLAALQATRRLSQDEKHALIDALSPYAGQRVTISAIAGDEDGKAYAQDFVEVFEAAGWQHPAVSYRSFDRDPVGVEITLNEADGRAGRINASVGALINIARRLSLTDGNTIYLNAEVPSGQVQVKIGKKLPR